eukprot:bmy_14678T0
MTPWRFAGLCCSSSRRASPPAWGPALECGCEPQETCRPLQTTVYLSGQDFCGQHLECLPPKAKHSGRQKLNSAFPPSRASEASLQVYKEVRRCLVFIVSGEQKWSEAEEIVLHDLSNEEK